MPSIYEISVPVLLKQLSTIDKLLTKAEAHCREKGLSEEALLSDRLIDDMLPLSFQIRALSWLSIQSAAHLARKTSVFEPPPKASEPLPSVAAARELVAASVKELEAYAAGGDFAPRPDEAYELTSPTRPSITFPNATALATALEMPNFTFHCVTAYSLLRKNGVSIGKFDWLNLG